MFVYYNNCNENRRSKGGFFMKIVNFPRFIVAISIFACVVSFIMSMATSQVFSAEPIEYKSIVVSKGDTLWGIASNINGDIQENIYEISMKNNLDTSIIYEGQTLLVPNK